MPAPSIAGLSLGDVEDALPGHRPLRGFHDIEARGKVAYQVNQRLVGRVRATFFIGNEYEPDFFGIFAGRVGGDLDEPCQGPRSC